MRLKDRLIATIEELLDDEKTAELGDTLINVRMTTIKPLVGGSSLKPCPFLFNLKSIGESVDRLSKFDTEGLQDNLSQLCETLLKHFEGQDD